MSSIPLNSLSFDFDKDLPPINCSDLFPSSLDFKIDENIRTESTESGYKSASELNIISPKTRTMSTKKSTRHSNHNKNKSVSPSPSPSFTSETESFEENAGNKRKKRKRFCYTCDTEFRRTKDFLSHLRGHVTMPYLNIKKLPDDNAYVKAYLDSKKKQEAEPSKCLILKVKKLAGMLNYENQFKIVDQTDTIIPKEEPIDEVELNNEIIKEKVKEPEAEIEKLSRPTVRVLRPEEIKQSKSPQLEAAPQPMKLLENMQVPNNDGMEKSNVTNHNSGNDRNPENYFECPTLDGLDQFTQDGMGENADVLLRKLLNCNQQDLNMNIVEPDQWPGNSIPNEFISLDRLAVFCTVCNVTFENEMQLFEHKRMTGHDFPMNSNAPPHHMSNQMQNSNSPHRPMHPMHEYHQQQQRLHFQQQSAMGYPSNHPDARCNGMVYPTSGHPHQTQPGERELSMQSGNPYPSSYMYGPQGQQPPMNYSSQQQQHQMMMRRPPPPLYRVPQPQQMMPPNAPHGSHSYHPQHMQHNNYRGNYPINPEISRSGEFMKTRLQKDQNSITPPISSDQIKQSNSPPVIMGTPTQVRPRFLTPPIRQQLLRQHAAQQAQHQAQQAQHAQQRMHQQMASRQPVMVNNQGAPIIRPPGPGIKMPGIMVSKQSSMSSNGQKEMPPGPGSRITGVTAPREFRKIAPRLTSSPPRTPDSSQLGPAIKKIRLELKQPRPNSSNSPSQNRQDGLPIIKSVIGNAIKIHSSGSPKPSTPPITDRESPINDHISLSMKFGESKKDPKEVANLLATRGIIVTQKSSTKTRDSTETSSQISNTPSETAAKEAIQKLQMNNSVSIISKKKSEEVDNNTDNNNPNLMDSNNSESVIVCNVDNCQEKFQAIEQLNRHTSRIHPSKSNSNTNSSNSSNSTSNMSNNNGSVLNIRAFKCKICPALFSSQEGVQDHQWKQHKITQSSADELGVPVVDLRNELTKKKLAALGITNYIPLCNKTSSNCYGFPIVSVQGASNTNVCNLLGLGASSILSLGPVKPIPKG